MSEDLQETGEMMEAAAPQEANVETQETEQNRQVPLTALESERAKRQQIEEENRMMREHLALMQAQQRPAQEPPNEFDGLDDSDVLTLGEFKKLSGKMASQFKGTLDELRMQQRYPDYQEVITKHLPEVLKTNPSLKASLSQNPDYELAYYLAKNSDSYRSEHGKKKRSEDAERIIKNTQQAGSISSLGSSTPVAQAKSYKSMSDDEFKRVMAKNLGY